MDRFWHGFESPSVIDRPALRVALDRSLASRMTLVVAQAGAGKTTLLRQWRASHPEMEFVVIDVDESDDDPMHFSRRLVSAVATLHPEVTSASGAVAPLADGLCAEFISELVSALQPLPNIVIVFDNLHRLTNLTLVSDLGRLVQRTPDNVHCVLSTRVDPPMSLSHHRLNDDLLELRRADLAFSEDEAMVLLERLSGSPLPPDVVHVLWDRTEGWAAGLQLAGLNLRHHDDPRAFVAAFGGSDRLVADYLGEEVLASLSAERRRLLLQLSALDDMCAGLVQATTGQSEAQSLLNALERESMFLVPLDSRGEWFRFHHLFRELLRSRLRTESPAEELKIITSAADWNLTQGRVRNAMEYLLRAQARDGALESMLSAAGSEAALVPSYSDAVQGEVSNALLSAHLRAEVLRGVREVLSEDAAGRQPRPDGSLQTEPEWWNGRSRPGLGYVAAQVLWRARPEASPEAARRRLLEIEARCSRKPPNRLTRQDAGDIAGALIAGGRAHFLTGNPTEARKWLGRALIAAGPDVVERIAASSALSLVEAWCGNIQQANVLVAETLAMARDAGMLSLPSIADASLASVLTALDEDDTAPTASLLEASPATRELLSNTHRPRLPAAVAALTPTVLFERAIASLDSEDSYAARTIVENWSDLIPSPEPLSVVQYHILRAWLASDDNAAEEVRRQLTEAVRVAEVHGLVDVFVHAGPTILSVLPSVSGPQAAYSAVITARARLAEDVVDGVELPESLTDRESEILSYLPTRFSNVDLAQRFFVSVNTIKTHIAHIYRKLDVADRDAAIRRARELGLL